jgi:hypothetical protein
VNTFASSRLRSALDQLARDLVEAVLRTVRTEIAEALDCRRIDAVTPDRARKERARPSRPGGPARDDAATPLELSLPQPDVFPDTSIVDPLAVLGFASRRHDGDQPAAPVSHGQGVVPATPDGPLQQPVRAPRRRAPRRVTAAVVHEAAPAPSRAMPPTARAGEDVVQAAGGGFVLRRRRNVPLSS